MTSESTLNIAVFVSGRGSNLRAIHDAILAGTLDARIRCILMSKDTEPVMNFASECAIPCMRVPRDPAALMEILRHHGVDFIALAGYLKLVPPEIVRAFPRRIVNIHPALLPAFGGRGMYGHHVHEAVLASGVRTTGVTVHFVTEEYDRGPIVLQREVPVLDDDTPDSLAARVLIVEHALYPEALQLLATGQFSHTYHPGN